MQSSGRSAGSQPADLPVRQTTIEFVIILKIAKMLDALPLMGRGTQSSNRASFAAVHLVRKWHKADMAIALSDVRFWG